MRLGLLESDLGPDLADIPEDELLAAIEAELPRYVRERLRSKLPFVVAGVLILTVAALTGRSSRPPTPTEQSAPASAGAAATPRPSGSTATVTPQTAPSAGLSAFVSSNGTSGGESSAADTTNGPVAAGLTYTRAATLTGPNAPPSAVWMPGGSWLDQDKELYLLADTNSDSLDIVDARTGSFVGAVHGFGGGPHSVTVDDQGFAWVTGADSAVRVVDLTTLTIVASVSTGGTGAADQIAFDPDDHVMLVTNPSERVPGSPFLTVISTVTRTVASHVVLANAGPGTATPVWDSGSRTFLVPTEELTGELPGLAAGELVAVDPVTSTIARRIPLGTCLGSGTTLGPNREVLVGCRAAIPDAAGVVVDIDTGDVLATITGYSGVDEVRYDSAVGVYYLAAGVSSDPALVVVNSSSREVVAALATGTYATSVAASSDLGRIFVPVTGEGIAVFQRNGT